MLRTLALAGAPNCGKTTLFNALTGARQKVGNWPGVTVEKFSGQMRLGDESFEVVDLPGTQSLDNPRRALDEQISRDYIASGTADLIINVVDAASLEHSLLLTQELLAGPRPVIVALSMMDVAVDHGRKVDPAALARELGVPVVPINARRGDGLSALQAAVRQSVGAPAPLPDSSATDTIAKFARADAIAGRVQQFEPITSTLSARVDAVVLNPWVALPCFLGVMYLLFTFSINVGGAFIDFFDIAGGALFVESPRWLLNQLGTPEWLVVLLATGVGGGVQLVGTFVPIIGSLFLCLAFLEDSGYMARAAVTVDRAMRAMGLPGKSFVPLIVGFGCNVPAVMAARSLDRPQERLLAVVMAPYMSCGARLTVYALFAAAFFPSSGQNLVFLLYLLGIAVAAITALLLRRFALGTESGGFIMQLPPYHLPSLRSLVFHTWYRLRDFMIRAGRAIIIVVIFLNVANSIGTDGSFGNEDSETSVLSAIGQGITPVFGPMGISQDNWPATVGLFTGFFAKEVTVGTLDALYGELEDSPASATAEPPFSLIGALGAALSSIGTNFLALGDALVDPLGISIGPVDDVDAAATAQGVERSTIGQMQQQFHGQIGAFSYMLFLLLYAPCVATLGAIHREQGAFWSAFSMGWSFTVAWALAVLCFQLGTLTEHPNSSLAWSAFASVLLVSLSSLLITLARRHSQRSGLIPVAQLP